MDEPHGKHARGANNEECNDLGTGTDDSPFIRPSSPTTITTQLYQPTDSFLKGFGSMRAGTQTLIQALHAFPFEATQDEEGDEEGEDIVAPLVPDDTPSSDEEAADGLLQRQMGASLFAIHRPLEWSRRAITLPAHIPTLSSSPTDYFSPPREGENRRHGYDDGLRLGEDNDPTPGSSLYLRRKDLSSRSLITPPDQPRDAKLIDTIDGRSKRQTQLAEKLKDIFELDQAEEVLREMPCWLLRSVLLQGFMYLTTGHMCFFAHIPNREGQVIKSGLLTKKSNRTKRWIRYWFALKDDALSWYQSSSDPYFPHGVVDLRYVLSCEPLRDKEVRIRTNGKNVTLAADSVPNRDEWVKAIRKIMFKAQNSGESVKISIPYSAILDVDVSHAMDFSETIEVKVIDAADRIAMDSYLFAHFRDPHKALDHIRDAVRAHRSATESRSPSGAVRDSTVRRSDTPVPQERALPTATPSPISARHALGVFKLPSFLRPFSGDNVPSTIERTMSAPVETIKPEESPISHVKPMQDRGVSGRDVAKSLPPIVSPENDRPMHEASEPYTASSRMSANEEHAYPPSPSPPALRHHLQDHANAPSWGIGIPSWLKPASRGTFTFPFSYHSSTVSEVYTSSNTGHAPIDIGYSSLISERAPDPVVLTKFTDTFALGVKEALLGYIPGSILRLFPTPGLLMISTNYFCFRSSGKLASKTRMVLPLRDILSTQDAKPFRYGQQGLVVVIRGHEELFFEFSSIERRGAFVSLLEHQMDLSQKQNSRSGLSDGNLIESPIEDQTEPQEEDGPSCAEGMMESLPAVMFTSASSTFLSFKPDRSLHFTFLTIGSRGDVQPYIALAKGLMTDGHRVRIATHTEYQDWVEAFGIEFGAVGGDPAELMRICVENGMFTVSFLKETLQNFRGWLDDLLASSWEACQNTDVLIESPSAMAGIHIAEALDIPYFRAFTMPWSRTRAYPHAFAVPDQKMGGNYNYMSYVMFDQVFWRATAGQLNRWRRKTLNIPSTSLDRMQQHKTPFLYNFSPTIVPSPLDWPEWIRVTGYWFLEDADPSGKKWIPPPSLVRFIDDARRDGKRLIYIGFGSVVVSDPDAMTRMVVEAVLRSGVRAVLSKGWSDRFYVRKETGDAATPEPPLPKEIYSISALPHDWLFSRIDAVCHHGGAGTTGASLRAGIPTIIRPFFGDQYFWGERVEALGIGTCIRNLTVETLSQAFILATTDQKRIDKAREIGEQIRAEKGVANAIETIYRDLDYARVQVKRRQRQVGVDATGGPTGAAAERSGDNNEGGVVHDRDRGEETDDEDLESEGEWSVISDQHDES